MLEKLLTTAGAVAGILASVAVPIIVAWVNNREKKRRREDADPELQPTFGMTVGTALERADAAHEALLQEVKEQRDDAEREVEYLRARLNTANLELAKNGLETH